MIKLTQRASLLQPLTAWPWAALCQLLPSSQLQRRSHPVYLAPWTPRPSCTPASALRVSAYLLSLTDRVPHLTTQPVTSSQQHVGSAQSLRDLCALSSSLPRFTTDTLTPNTYILFCSYSQPWFTVHGSLFQPREDVDKTLFNILKFNA